MTDQEKKIFADSQKLLTDVAGKLETSQRKENELATGALLRQMNDLFVKDYKEMAIAFKAMLPLMEQIAKKGGVSKEIIDALKSIKLEPRVDNIKVTVPEIKIPRPKVNVDVKAPEVKIPKVVVSMPKAGINVLGFSTSIKSILSALKGIFNANMFVYGKHISNDNPLPCVLVDTKGNPYRAVSGGGAIVGGGGNSGQSSNATFARNAINEASYDVEAAAYDETTEHTEHYGLTGIFIQFSQAVSKTITLSLTDGTTTIPFKTWATDTATSRVFLPDKNWKITKGWEIKVDVTKVGSTCLMNLLLITH